LLLNRLLIPRSSHFFGTKELVSFRLDKQALAAFKATGPGWQVRINETLMRSAKRLGVK
jgi:uncharacterized protein (DUF4415 family)